jgi:hypothetical protein
MNVDPAAYVESMESDRIREAEARPRRLIERSERLNALLSSDVWTSDVLPSLERLDADAQTKILTSTGEARDEAVGYVKAIQDVVALFPYRAKVGEQALRRLAERFRDRLSLASGPASAWPLPDVRCVCNRLLLRGTMCVSVR